MDGWMGGWVDGAMGRMDGYVGRSIPIDSVDIYIYILCIYIYICVCDCMCMVHIYYIRQVIQYIIWLLIS